MASVASRTGRVELGHGCHAWIAGEAGWGMSNAGLITGGGESLLVDTLYDLRLTRTMLDALTPLIACTTATGTVAVMLAGAALILLTLPRGPVTHRYAGWDRLLVW